jgi:hypothetical protein
MGVSILENLGRCPRCRKFMVQEEWSNHQCDFHDIELTGVSELVMDTMNDLRLDRNGDHVYIAWALDGVFCRLVECKHNPPHATKRKFADQDRPPDKATVYHHVGSPVER